MILGIAIGCVAGFVGGIALTFFLRGRAIDAEVRVAHVLANSGVELGGFDIGEKAGIRSGTTYSVLAKFELLGMVESRWVVIEQGRSRRLWRWIGGPVGLDSR